MIYDIFLITQNIGSVVVPMLYLYTIINVQRNYNVRITFVKYAVSLDLENYFTKKLSLYTNMGMNFLFSCHYDRRQIIGRRRG